MQNFSKYVITISYKQKDAPLDQFIRSNLVIMRRLIKIRCKLLNETTNITKKCMPGGKRLALGLICEKFTTNCWCIVWNHRFDRLESFLAVLPLNTINWRHFNSQVGSKENTFWHSLRPDNTKMCHYPTQGTCILLISTEIWKAMRRIKCAVVLLKWVQLHKSIISSYFPSLTWDKL